MSCYCVKTAKFGFIIVVMQTVLLAFFLLGPLADLHADDTLPPSVVAVYPTDGASAVSGNLRTISIEFSEPMGMGASFISDTVLWGTSSVLWSGDRTAFYITRDTLTALDDGAFISFTLNPPESANPFQDGAGNPLASYTFSFTVGPDTTAPAVVWTSPVDGATGISPDIETVVIRFSEAMAAQFSVSNSGSWGPSDMQASPDMRTLSMTRQNAGTPLTVGETIDFTLNPEGSLRFQDLDGHLLATYTFSFTIGATAEPPTVVSTTPSDGETDVSADLETVSITFSGPMKTDYSIFSNFPGYTASWSAPTTITLLRNDLAPPLSPGETYFFTLNRDGATSFQDLSGVPLQEYTFDFTIEATADPPTVVSTTPSNGETDVSADLETVSITFSRPMKAGYSISSNFPGYTASWSAQTTITLLRDDLATPLSPGVTYFFTLNRDGTTSFQDLSGVPLQEYTFDFTVKPNYQLLEITANPDQGFSWPYFLSIPDTLGETTVLLVETNNTGGVSDDPSVHELAAENLAKWRSGFAVALDVPLLVPTFPRPSTQWWIYTHALDRDSLTTTVDGLQRIDNQLIAMISDARVRLTAMGYRIAERVFVNGYSASGSFANRFTLLHPEIVKAAASGSPGGWPTVPVSTWNDATLRYPVGIADLESIAGNPFDLDTFRRVPQYIYVGDMDDNDAVDYNDGFDLEDKDLIDTLFGDGAPYIAERWPYAEEIFSSVQSAAQFVIYPGVGHTVTQEMFSDLLHFFEKHHPGKITLAHAILALQVVAGINFQDTHIPVDINGDGKIGIEEALCILQFVSDQRN